MKKIILILMIVIAIFTFAACGGDTQPASNDNQEATEQFEVPTGPFNERDMIFVYNGVPYPISSDVAPLLNALGGQYEEMAAPSCAFTGEDKTFIFDDITILTYPDGDTDLINEIYFSQGSYTTSRGIGLGASLEEIKAAYGEAGVEQGSSYYYAVGAADDLSSPRLTFELTNGVVSGISYFGANGIIQ